jgi:hypothetical protein
MKVEVTFLKEEQEKETEYELKDFDLDNVKEIILDGEKDCHRIAFTTYDGKSLVHYATDIKSMRIV